MEITEPFSVCVSEELLRKAHREQRVLLGRAAFAMRNKAPIVGKLSNPDLADLIGAAIRICDPTFQRLGRARDELTKQLLKSCSRKARKALEAATQVIGPQVGELDRWLQAWTFSADRAGLLGSGDPCSALTVVLAEDKNAGADRPGVDPIAAIRARPRLEQLASFTLSEEHFQLRQQIGIAV